MIKILLFLLIGLPAVMFAMNIRVDIDVNVVNGDGTLTVGDKNNIKEERNQNSPETYTERNEKG